MNFKKSQRLFKKTLKDECDIFSKKRTRVNGQWKEAYIRVGHQVKCRVSTVVRQNTEQTPQERQEFVTPYVIYMLPMDVKQDDRILFKNLWYEVKTKPRNPSFADHHYELPVDTTDQEYKIIEVDGVVMLDV
ncbi:hypothetical protein ACFPRA_01380 [Sporosarcina soli]|uniref:Uncharacterized protein n=1 Tax=Sporosarcina soli TaxID=334736 RepID=A0ABW0TFA2_9BACL